MNLISSLLTVYTWVIVCILLFFLFAIARFYERKSGRQSFYASFLLPIILFAIATARYIPLAPAIVGDLWADLLRFAAGTLVGGFGLLLLRLMMGSRS